MDTVLQKMMFVLFVLRKDHNKNGMMQMPKLKDKPCRKCGNLCYGTLCQSCFNDVGITGYVSRIRSYRRKTR